MQHISHPIDSGIAGSRDMVMQGICDDPDEFLDFLNGDEAVTMQGIVRMIYDQRCTPERLHEYIQGSFEGALEAFVEMKTEELYGE